MFNLFNIEKSEEEKKCVLELDMIVLIRFFIVYVNEWEQEEDDDELVYMNQFIDLQE